MMFNAVLLLTVLSVMLAYLPLGHARCCDNSAWAASYCKLKPGHTTKQCGACCSVGVCNIFCCFCTQTCIYDHCVARRAAHANGSAYVDRVLSLADADGDGRVRLHEAAAYLASSGGRPDHAHLRLQLEALDLDNDGILSPGEIDSLD